MNLIAAFIHHYNYVLTLHSHFSAVLFKDGITCTIMFPYNKMAPHPMNMFR